MNDADKILRKLADLEAKLDAALSGSSRPATESSPPKFLTVREAMAAYRLSAPSVYRLPAYCLARCGRSVRVRRDALERYLGQSDLS